jgi:hypothetical protein
MKFSIGPETVSVMLSNPDFQGQFDLRPYVDTNVNGTRRLSKVMSGMFVHRRTEVWFFLSMNIPD